MQKVAYDLFHEINLIRQNQTMYVEEFGEYSDIAVDELSKFPKNSEDYVWNEGIARAARHFLNDKGSCGTNGDVYGFGFRSLLSSLYVYTYEHLEYEIFSTPFLINLESPQDSTMDSLLFILSQTHINKDLLRHQFEKEIGIGCACSGETFEGEHMYQCIIAVAESAPARDLIERIPVYQDALTDDQCSDKCEYLKEEPDYSNMFIQY